MSKEIVWNSIIRHCSSSLYAIITDWSKRTNLRVRTFHLILGSDVTARTLRDRNHFRNHTDGPTEIVSFQNLAERWFASAPSAYLRVYFRSSPQRFRTIKKPMRCVPRKPYPSTAGKGMGTQRHTVFQHFRAEPELCADLSERGRNVERKHENDSRSPSPVR